MKKRIILILSGLLVISLVSAQDIIIKKDGREINCKITSVDSEKIYSIFKSGKVKANMTTKLAEVSSYTFKGVTTFVQNIDSTVVLKSVSYTPKTPQQLRIFADSVENFNKYFVYTSYGDIIYGDNVVYSFSGLSAPVIKVDSKSFQAEFVRFYKNETGFYANTRNFSSFGLSSFSTRIRKGKINLYETVNNFESPRYYNSMSGTWSGGHSNYTITNFYNIGFGELKLADYKNLQYDMSDNPESMKCLQKYKSTERTQIGLAIAGYAFIAGGFVAMLKQSSNNYSLPIGLLSAGAIVYFSSRIVGFSKPKHLRKAIDVYNR